MQTAAATLGGIAAPSRLENHAFGWFHSDDARRRVARRARASPWLSCMSAKPVPLFSAHGTHRVTWNPKSFIVRSLFEVILGVLEGLHVVRASSSVKSLDLRHVLPSLLLVGVWTV